MKHKWTARHEPNRATCPDIDRIIAHLEELRESNGTLRDWGNELVTDLEKQDEEIENLQGEVANLNDQVETLTREIKQREQA